MGNPFKIIQIYCHSSFPDFHCIMFTVWLCTSNKREEGIPLSISAGWGSQHFSIVKCIMWVHVHVLRQSWYSFSKLTTFGSHWQCLHKFSVMFTSIHVNVLMFGQYSVRNMLECTFCITCAIWYARTSVHWMLLDSEETEAKCQFF